MEFYHYPPGKQVSPFAPVDAGAYFAEAGKFSYLGSFEEIGNISSPFDSRNRVLDGAFVLNILKRHSVVRDGALTYINPGFDDGHATGASRLDRVQFVVYTDRLHEYRVDSWGGRPLKSYAIKNDDGSYNCALQPKLFPSAAAAVQYAAGRSKGEPMSCIIAQWFADIDRH